jgi:hypothetical protein
MAMSRAANLVEKAMGHEKQPITTDVSNYSADDYGDPNQKMKALTWQGKNCVKVGEFYSRRMISMP